MDYDVPSVISIVSKSGCLGETRRQHDLLQYLLTEKEQGRLESITQYSIAVDVLGRSEDFDATTDSIVRVEMHRLRKNLERFNLDSKTIELSIPRASFNVIVTDKTKNHVFSGMKSYLKPFIFATVAIVISVFGMLFVAPDNQAKVVASNCSSVVPNVSVMNSGSSGDLQLYVGMIIQSTLPQYTSVHLVENIEACSDSGTPSFTVDYMVMEENGSYRVALTVYNEHPSNIVGFRNISGIIASSEDRDDLYYSIVKFVGDLVKPYGKIPRYAATKKWDIEEIANNYKCMLTMYDSYTSDSSEDYSKALSCLTKSSTSKYATDDIKGGLALSYIAQYRQNRDATTGAPMLAAKNLIDMSKDEWIRSAEMTMAKILYEVDRPDYNAERLEDVLNAAENQYSENPHILIVVAGYAGFKLGDWDRAKYLSKRIPLIHSERDNSVFLVDAAFELVNNQSNINFETCLLAYSENSLFSNLLVNSCAQRTGNVDWIKKTNVNLSRLNYSNKDKRVQYVQSRQFESSFSNSLVAALKLQNN